MAIIKCPDCGAAISDAAVACPRCGRPNALAQLAVARSAVPTTRAHKRSIASQAASGCLKGVLIVAVAMVGLLGVAYLVQQEGKAERARKASESIGPTEFVSAVDLIAAYSRNEVDADNRFKSKRIQVSGAVVRIGKDILDKPYLTLEGGDALRTVQCFFGPEDAHFLSGLSPGAFVSVQGDCTGLMGNVLLEKCRLLP